MLEVSREKVERAKTLLSLIKEDVSGMSYPDDEKPKDAFKAMVGIVLSHRTVGRNAWMAHERLFSVYSSLDEFLSADEERIRELIKPAGLSKGKAKAIKLIAKKLVEEYNGVVPLDETELAKFPRFGVKSRAALLSIFGIPRVCVDTHVYRIARRLGLASSADAGEVEKELEALYPQELWLDINPAFVFFGRTRCRSQNPKCEKCPIASVQECNFYIPIVHV